MTTPKRKSAPASMASIFADKGAAKVAPDVTQPTLQAHNADEDTLTSLVQPNRELASILNELTAPKVTADHHPLAKGSVNVKLGIEKIQKLKQILGNEQRKRMSTYSQQDWLESRLNALIDYEFDQLPKF